MKTNSIELVGDELVLQLNQPLKGEVGETFTVGAWTVGAASKLLSMRKIPSEGAFGEPRPIDVDASAVLAIYIDESGEMTARLLKPAFKGLRNRRFLLGDILHVSGHPYVELT